MTLKPIKPQTDLQLKHELPYYQKLPPGGDIFEGGPQHLVMATVDNQDLLFWISPYIMHGRTPGGYLAENAVNLHTMFYTVPAKERGVMHDNDFICRGWNPSEYLDLKKLRVDSTSTEVTWKLKGTQLICRPPHFEVKGRNEGMGYDLKVTATAPTAWFVGDFENLATAHIACFDQLTVSEGSIRVGRKTYPISRGYGTHEHPVHCISVVDGFSHPMHWIIGGGEELQFFTFKWGDPPTSYGRVMVEGKFVPYDTGVSIDVLEEWRDPRSLITIPSKWHINMFSPQGILDVTAAASGRAYYLWCARNGFVAIYWILGTVNGSYLFPNGRTIPIKDMLFQVEWGQTILRSF